MSRYRLGVVALVLLSAGCLGFEAGGATEQPSVSTRAPGIANGSVDATALVAAHERSLDGVAVAVETTQSRWGTDVDNRTVDTRTLTDGNGTLWRRQLTQRDTTRTRVERWQQGGDSLRYVADTGAVVATDGAATPGERYGTAALETWLAAGEYEVDAVESGGQTGYVLTSTTYTPPNGEALEADTVRYEAAAVVTPAGRVTAMSATLVTVETNRWGRHVRAQSYEYRVARSGGVEPTRPEWVPERAAAAPEGGDG